MTEFYTSLKRKLSKYILEIYLSAYIVFFIWNEFLTNYFSPFLFVNTLTVCFIYFICKKSQFQSKYCQLIIFIFYNPLFDTLIADFSIYSKSIFYIVIIFLYFNIIYKNIKLIYLANAIFLCSISLLTFFQSRKSQIIVESNSNISNFIINKIRKNESVDVIILDAYPNFNILRDSFKTNPKLKLFLDSHDFKQIPHHSYSTKTQVSMAQILLNKKIIPSEVAIELNHRQEYYEYIIGSNIFKECTKNNFHFNLFSPTNYKFNNDGWQIYWNKSNSRYFGLFMRAVNNWNKFRFLLTNYSSDTIKTFDDQYTFMQIDQYNKNALNQFAENLNNQNSHVHIYHLLTFHKYNIKNPLQAFKSDLKIADSLGIDMLNKLLKKNTSNIIILSDHGNRTLLKSQHSKKMGIMAIKEL